MAKNNLYLSLDGFDTDLKFHFNLKNNSKKDLKVFVKQLLKSLMLIHRTTMSEELKAYCENKYESEEDQIYNHLYINLSKFVFFLQKT